MPDNWQEATVTFSVDHPAGAGHFPGSPIMPGALLLDVVRRTVTQRNAPYKVRQVKFLRIIRPGEAMTVRWQTEGAAIKFECLTATAPTPAITGSFA